MGEFPVAALVMAEAIPSPGRPISACERCRMRKVGCDRTKPRCKKCARVKAKCHYTTSPPSAEASASVGAARHPLPEHGSLSSPSPPKPAAAALGIPKSRRHVGVSLSLELPSALDAASSPSRGAHMSCTAAPNPTGESPRPPRDRVILSCMRCRRQKVRCDRNMPCGRCVKNKRAPQCIYADADSSPAVEPPTSEKEQDPLSVIATSFINSQWNPLVQNGSHWHSLLQQMENYLPQWPSQRTGPSLQQEKPVSRMVPTINYPFNGDTVGRGAIVRVLAQLPPRPVQELFVSYYLNSVEKTYHLLHLEEFDRELQEFWEDPAAKAEDWLAQYFVILGLGCQAMNYCSEESGNEAHRSMPTGFLRSAELCLKRTPYMLMTSLANVRTLIMIVMSKQMYAMSYHEADTCWPLTGLIVRLSIRMGLHRAAWKPYTQRSHEEKVKSQVWAVVLVLEMRQSLVCGMPLLLRAADISSVESNTSQTPSTGNTTLGDSRIDYGSFGNKDPIILTRLLAVSDDDLLFRAIELATSPMGGTPYSDVAAVDTSLRDKLYQSGIGLANSHLEADKPAKDIDLEVCMVQIFFRQVFMALHARFSLQPNASTEHPVSYVSSLESALAILAYQRGLCEGEKWAELSAWFAGFFRHEFFMAAMTVCSLLIRDLESTAVSSHTGFCETQPRKIMLDALQSCRDMWKKEKTWSVCNANAFALVDNLVCVLRHAHEQGCSIPL